MNKLTQLKTFIKTNPMELDVIMMEVYQQLTHGMQGFSMFDGGSHKGWHALRMLKLMGCKEVFAVEADPSMGRVVSDNLTKWHTSSTPQLHLVLKALQDDPETTEIPWMSSHSHIGRSSIQSRKEDGVQTIWADHADVQYRDTTHVPATTIDQILVNADQVPFLKLDLEGADFLAMQGAKDTLKNKRPVIAFENSSKAPAVHGYSLEDASAFFMGQGYIPLSYVGEPLTFSNWFDFYEAWAVPQERFAEVYGLISRGIEQRI